MIFDYSYRRAIRKHPLHICILYVTLNSRSPDLLFYSFIYMKLYTHTHTHICIYAGCPVLNAVEISGKLNDTGRI